MEQFSTLVLKSFFQYFLILYRYLTKIDVFLIDLMKASKTSSNSQVKVVPDAFFGFNKWIFFGGFAQKVDTFAVRRQIEVNTFRP